MSNLSKVFIAVALSMIAASCARTARIDVTLADAPSSDITVRLLDINRYKTVDTLKTDAEGKLSYKMEVAAGQPEFVYLYHNDTKLASLILESGDKVSVVADTLGNNTVEGSEESLKLAQVENDYADALARMTRISEEIAAAGDSDKALELRKELGQEYIAYYRKCVKYVMSNSHSLTVIPVFYQNFGESLPVFGQSTDAIHFRAVADSLSTVYPESKYVKALKQEADRRQGYLELETRLQNAKQIGFPDIELPDLQGQKRKLSEVDSKVVMVQFWSAAEAAQKMANLDMLLPIYNDYHKRGFEIYQISLDVDKAVWARVAKEQKLPWISVCDSRGAASPYAASYNVPVLPATYIICDGELVDGQAVDAKSLRRLLDKLLK